MNAHSLCPVLALGLLAGLVACQEDDVVAPDEDAVAPHELGIAAKKPSDDTDKYVGLNMDMTNEPDGGYYTASTQKVLLTENPKVVSILAKGGEEIDYWLEPEDLAFTTHFGDADCRIGGNTGEFDIGDFWDAWLYAQAKDPGVEFHTDRILTAVVLPREAGEPSEGHRSEGYWFTVEDAGALPEPLNGIDTGDRQLDKIQWQFKIGVNPSIFDDRKTSPQAVADWDGTTAVHTGGTLRFMVMNCGPPEQPGCQGEGRMAVACDNRISGDPYSTRVTFTLAVDRNWQPPS